MMTPHVNVDIAAYTGMDIEFKSGDISMKTKFDMESQAPETPLSKKCQALDERSDMKCQEFMIGI